MWMTLINTLSIINIAIICIYLTVRKNNILPNYILALAFFIPGLYFVDNLFILNNLLSQYPYTFFLVQSLAVFFPPIVYYYVHLLLSDQKKFHDLLALGSALLLFLILKITYDFSLLSESKQQAYLINLGNAQTYPTLVMVYTVVFYGWQMVYFAVLAYEVYSYYQRAQNALSHFDKIKVDFLKKFITLLCLLNIGLVIFYISLPMPLVDYGILPTMVSIINVFIIYFAVKHNAVFSKTSYQNLIEENQLVQLENDTDAQVNLPLKEQKLLELGIQIEHLITSRKLYQNPDIRLLNIAQLLNEPEYLISQALNKHFKKSFFELINELRINDALVLLQGNEAKIYTIEGIAFEVGFNSRAAFYRAFKKQTGKTPKDYL